MQEQNPTGHQDGADLRFTTIVAGAEFRRNPEQSTVLLINYGLRRHQAGVEGHWPDPLAAPPKKVAGCPPEHLLAVYRVDGLGMALLALRHAEASGIPVSGGLRGRIEVSILAYVGDGDRLVHDLELTASVGDVLGQQELLKAGRTPPPLTE